MDCLVAYSKWLTSFPTRSDNASSMVLRMARTSANKTIFSDAIMTSPRRAGGPPGRPE